MRPFAGDTAANVIGAILKDHPQGLVSRQPLAPASLDRLITTCLEKDPDNRWQSARDMTRELQWIAKGETRGSRSGPQHRATVCGGHNASRAVPDLPRARQHVRHGVGHGSDPTAREVTRRHSGRLRRDARLALLVLGQPIHRLHVVRAVQDPGRRWRRSARKTGGVRGQPRGDMGGG